MENSIIRESKIKHYFFDVSDKEINEAGRTPFEVINLKEIEKLSNKGEWDIFCVSKESTHDNAAKVWHVKLTISYYYTESTEEPVDSKA